MQKEKLSFLRRGLHARAGDEIRFGLKYCLVNATLVVGVVGMVYGQQRDVIHVQGEPPALRRVQLSGRPCHDYCGKQGWHDGILWYANHLVEDLVFYVVRAGGASRISKVRVSGESLTKRTARVPTPLSSTRRNVCFMFSRQNLNEVI